MAKPFEPTRRTNSPAVKRQVSAGELGRMAGSVEKLDRVSANRWIGIHNSGAGPVALDQRPWDGWVEITAAGTDAGGNPCYAWRQVVDSGDGMFFVPAPGSARVGTPESGPLYEVNGNDAVPVGARVHAWISNDHQSYLFWWSQGVTETNFWYLVDVDIYAEYNITFDVDVTYEGDVTINEGTWIFPSTADADTAPAAKLVLPTLTVDGPPAWPGTYGEIVCGGAYLYQSDGLDWYPYIPWSPYADFPPEEGGLTYIDEDGYYRNDPDYLHWDDGTKTLTIAQLPSPISDSWRITNNAGAKVVYVNGDTFRFPTTSNPLVAPPGRLIIPVLTVSGPPQWVGIIGEIVCDGPCIYQYDGTQWVDYCDDDCCPDGEIGTIQAVTAVECVDGILNVTTTDFDFVYEDCCLTIVEDEPVVTEAGCCDCTAVTECCGGVAIARTLYLDFADDTDCACADTATTVELVYDAGDQSWKGSGTLCGLSLNFKFYCYSPPDGWALEAPGSADFGGSTGLPTTCSPFVWDETGSVNNSDCTGGNGIVAFVISDVPP